MPRATTNKSMRLDEPRKEMRRRPPDEGETDDANRVPGATGQTLHGRRRPGRAASLLSSSNRTRSQAWRSPKRGARKMRRGVLAKGSRTHRR